MKHQVWKVGLLVAIVAAMAGSTVFAAGAAAPAEGKSAAAAAPAPPEHTELFLPEVWETLHDPTPWLHMGLDFRFRSVYGENWYTLNDDYPGHKHEYQRYRTRWWTNWVLGEDISVNTRLTWEFRTWDERDKDVNFNADEALFDWMNVNLRNIGGMPLTGTIGRQDIILGDAWLVLDGTPLDGSRTIYFDAARFTYDWADTSTKFDMIYVDQHAESDHWLKPINDQDRAVTEQDEQGAILWVTNRSYAPVQIEGFFIYKNDNPVNEQLTNLPSIWSRKAEIYTFGAAVSGMQGEHWKYRAEGAIQRGTKYDGTNTLGVLGTERDLEAYGAQANLEYLFKDSMDNATHIAYEYDSGDDPSTADNEQFDLLWGEWPRWSELLIYTYTYETMPAFNTNLHRFNVGHRVNLTKRLQVTADYHALWADQNSGVTIPGRLFVSDDHKFRGCLFTNWWRYKFSSQLSGHFLAEYFIPGSFYVAPSDDDAYFLRLNLEYTF